MKLISKRQVILLHSKLVAEVAVQRRYAMKDCWNQLLQHHIRNLQVYQITRL